MSHLDTLREVKAAADTYLEGGVWHIAAGVTGGKMAERESAALGAVLRFVAAFDANVNGTEHLIRFDDNGWVVEHPARERVLGSLLECTYRGPDVDPQVRGMFILNPDGTYGDPCDPDANLREAYKALFQSDPGAEA